MSVVTYLPSWKNCLLALLAAGLLILAFPDFEIWFLAWFALVPLMWAVEREKTSSWRSFLLGWLFGTAFFFGTCWWLTYAPIHYAAVPWPLAYLMIFVACLAAGLFPGLFAGTLALLLRRYGMWAFLGSPFVWVACEFARYWITGNNWNALGYSQALRGGFSLPIVWVARIGGVLLSSGLTVLINALILLVLLVLFAQLVKDRRERLAIAALFAVSVPATIVFISVCQLFQSVYESGVGQRVAYLTAVQPNVPMSGLDQNKWTALRQRQISLAAAAASQSGETTEELPMTVVLPESPMNYAYDDDLEFHRYINDFAAGNKISVLFNSSQPDRLNGRYFNSAVLVGADGELAAQYDKIYLLPFGEAVPMPLENIVPAFVGRFSYGSKYALIPLGDARAGVMICFESHFGELSRRYVQNGADAIIEMTNDGYLGPTPVLRQHLANAVFRAVETNRPVLRVTNVGITAYIDERGNVHDELPPYTEGTRVWSVSKSDGSQTFYVKYGDWFAWLCTIVTGVLVAFTFRRRREVAEARA